MGDKKDKTHNDAFRANLKTLTAYDLWVLNHILKKEGQPSAALRLLLQCFAKSQ